ncbi:MAG: dihydropteroate synthase [Candidatus Thorarchaeota archaeon]
MSLKTNNLFGLLIGPGAPVRLMGVLNLSPESFYKESVVQSYEHIKNRINRFIHEGAEILDLGPKSTAPVDIYGKPTYITPEEEILRLKIPLEVLNEIKSEVLISIDTQSPVVANYCINQGATIINDISGFHDPKMAEIVSSHQVGAVIMATKEKPGDVYTLNDIRNALTNSVSIAEDKGVDLNKLILDPGIGGWVSSRHYSHDYEIIKQLEKIRIRELPILVAISRKSFIGAVLAAPPEDRLYGSLAATAIAVLNGANIIRTHDLKPTKDAVKIAEKLRK